MVCMHAKSPQSCLTVSDNTDCSLPGSSGHGILQARYWSGLPCPPPGNLLTQGSNLHVLCLLHWQGSSLSLPSPGKPQDKWTQIQIFFPHATRKLREVVSQRLHFTSVIGYLKTGMGGANAPGQCFKKYFQLNSNFKKYHGHIYQCQIKIHE